MLSRRVLNRTPVYQINREEVPPGNHQKGLLEGKPTVQLNRTLGFPDHRAPGLKLIQSPEAILKESSFQYGMEFSIENGFFIPTCSLAAEKKGPGLEFSNENENFKTKMNISSENGSFVRGGMFFFIILQFPNAVVLNAVGRRNTQMRAKSANERKRKSAKERKRAQKSAKARENCKQPGLKQPGLGTPNSYSGNGLRVKTQRVKTSETFSEESNLPRRFRRYPEIL